MTLWPSKVAITLSGRGGHLPDGSASFSLMVPPGVMTKVLRDMITEPPRLAGGQRLTAFGFIHKKPQASDETVDKLLMTLGITRSTLCLEPPATEGGVQLALVGTLKARRAQSSCRSTGSSPNRRA